MVYISIGNGIKKIEARVFDGCPIEEFYCYAATPPEIWYQYQENQIIEGAILYVPARSGSQYKTSKWSWYFDNIIEMD